MAGAWGMNFDSPLDNVEDIRRCVASTVEAAVIYGPSLNLWRLTGAAWQAAMS